MSNLYNFQVPGRMGLLVTLFLISSNVYGSVNAPINRGFSYIELWVLGTQGIIMLAIMEYGFVLALKRINKRSTIQTNSEAKHENARTFDEKIKMLDIITFVISIFLFAYFNTLYWGIIAK